MASDGVWDVMSNEEAVTIVQNYIHQHIDKNNINNNNISLSVLASASDILLEKSLLKGSVDNMSAIVIWLKQDNNNDNLNIEEEAWLNELSSTAKILF
jgi:serine/threonine protein phosphatase PrpC